MKRRALVGILGGIAGGFWWRRRSIVVAIATMALLPTDASDAARPAHPGKSSSRHKSATHVNSPRRHAVKLAALGPVAFPSGLKPVATTCDPAKFRIVLDVGHTAESEGAISARNVAEYLFNLRLARQIEEKLKAAGFAETKLLLTQGRARPSLFRRVAAANNLAADLLLSIHHDSVPDKFLENWEFEGKTRHFSDRFSGYSVFVSRNNADFESSLSFAELLGREMKANGLEYARQYSQAIMGRYQHPLLNEETGVYSYDKLIVLKSTRMPAVLLEAGSIINRDEELKMDSPERRETVSNGVAAAVKEYCDPRWATLGPL